MSTVPLNERLLRAAEVAELIGCSRAMAYRLMQRGAIPVVRIPSGKTIRVPQESLLEWIKVNTRGGVESSAAQAKPAPKSNARQALRKPSARKGAGRAGRG